jgi:type IV secretory pathway VirB10-like protein
MSRNENNLVHAIRSGASNSISQTGQQIVQRQLNIQPTLTIRPVLDRSAPRMPGCGIWERRKHQA